MKHRGIWLSGDTADTKSKNLTRRTIHLICSLQLRVSFSSFTHYAILDAEAQLVSEIRPANEHHGDRRAPDNVHLDPGLRLETLGKQQADI